MARAHNRVCSQPGCPHIQPEAKCPQHRQAAEHARGTTTQRGYGTAHQAARNQWKPAVQTGGVTCWRCAQPIRPDQRWDLGHDDHDRTRYRGPEHIGCNRATAGRRQTGL